MNALAVTAAVILYPVSRNGISVARGMDKPSLQEDKQDVAKRVLLGPEVPWSWTWKVEWPENAKIEAKLSSHGSYDRVSAEVFLRRNDTEFACARGAIRFKQQTLRVIWFGRSKGRAVHHTVKGQLAYRAGAAAEAVEGDETAVAPKNISAATAVLGTLAALARWFGTLEVHLNTTGDESGKLLEHLRSLGFAEPPDASPVSVGDPTPLVASCKTLALTCCPPEWRAELPPDSALSMLTVLC